MKTMHMPAPPRQTAESPSERAMRLARERMLIAQAREDVREGRILDDAEFDAWLDAYASDENSPGP